ncbi:hypothetical protein GGQ64_004580 [Rhizobium azooxidifex]|uniref:Uncharacterized protein n=1 Tax=Mycoplana azooxidifex TaxID=1636188 RepID=A0A7W6GL42_9HYPH|nr:hypothetical protein [Mycoplana azooxidifex]MBB3979340.1 hypothetical protein [Mycoplana azooxidifex]
MPANDNFDFDGTVALDGASIAQHHDDGPNIAGPRKEFYVRFSDQDAERLGFESNTVTVDYLLYLLSGQVAEEDQAAADLLEEMSEPYCH